MPGIGFDFSRRGVKYRKNECSMLFPDAMGDIADTGKSHRARLLTLLKEGLADTNLYLIMRSNGIDCSRMIDYTFDFWLPDDDGPWLS